MSLSNEESLASLQRYAAGKPTVLASFNTLDQLGFQIIEGILSFDSGAFTISGDEIKRPLIFTTENVKFCTNWKASDDILLTTIAYLNGVQITLRGDDKKSGSR